MLDRETQGSMDNDIDQRLIDYSQEYMGIDGNNSTHSNTQELQDIELDGCINRETERRCNI